MLKDATYDTDYEAGAKEKAVPAQRVRAAEHAQPARHHALHLRRRRRARRERRRWPRDLTLGP